MDTKGRQASGGSTLLSIRPKILENQLQSMESGGRKILEDVALDCRADEKLGVGKPWMLGWRVALSLN